MDNINASLIKVQAFLMSPPGMYIMVGIIVVLAILLILKYSEGFEGMVEGIESLAEYPKVFTELILPSVDQHVKDIDYENYFIKPTEKVMPHSPPMDQLELSPEEKKEEMVTPVKKVDLPSHQVDAPVDLGNGVVAMAKVSIPAQSVEVPSQTPVVIPEAEKTDVVVQKQTVTIPEQEGVIPGKVAGSETSVTVPVTIPAQTVVIEEQSSIIPTIEPFRL